MVADLRIEIFAYKLFETKWLNQLEIKAGTDILEIYGDECERDNSYIKACDELFEDVLYCRSNLFYSIYCSKISIRDIENIKSLSDVYEYISRICDQEDICGHLTVFERMFATFEIASAICLLIRTKIGKHIDVVRYGHVIWAMYFEKFTDEFYEKGGWKELKREAKSFKFLLEFVYIFSERTCYYLQSVKEATVNYHSFKNSINLGKRKDENSGHLSKLWIKFQIEHFESHISIPISYETSVNAYEVELLLKELKLLLVPPRCNSDDIELSTEKQEENKYSTELLYSKLNSASEVVNSNLDEDTHIHHLNLEHEISRMIKNASGDFSHLSANDVRVFQSKCSPSTLKNFNFNMDSNEYQELDEDSAREMNDLRQARSVDEIKISNIDHNIFLDVEMKRIPQRSIESSPYVSDFDMNNRCSCITYINNILNSVIDSFTDRNVDEKAKMANTDPVIYFHRKEKTEGRKNTSLKVYANSEDTGFSSKSTNNGNQRENSGNILQTRLNSKKDAIGTADIEDVSYTDQIVSSEMDDFSVEPSVTDFNLVNGNLNNVHEREKIRRARKELKNEQKNPEIKKFLNMILILGDMKRV